MLLKDAVLKLLAGEFSARETTGVTNFVSIYSLFTTATYNVSIPTVKPPTTCRY